MCTRKIYMINSENLADFNKKNRSEVQCSSIISGGSENWFAFLCLNAKILDHIYTNSDKINIFE